jgi:hypothetical protein
MRLSFSRDSWLALGLIALLVLVTIAAAIQQTRSGQMPALSSLSSSPDGGRALWLWLEELGYEVAQEAASTFEPPTEAGLILLLEPLTEITAEEWRLLDAWVEGGGTLILAGESFGMREAVLHYEFELAYMLAPVSGLPPQTPLWLSPPGGAADLQAHAYLVTDRQDYVAHIASADKPIILSFEQGQGRVILSAASFPFSNAGLKKVGNPALVLNMISAAKRPGRVWFDEWHHGLRATETRVVGPGDWLRYTPAGHALLYAAAVIFGAILLAGRHFGRPVPLPQDLARRAPLEYITAIANLNRRARQRAAVLDQYRHWLKRRLGQRYRLDPTLPDEQYLAQLNGFNPRLDMASLQNLLARLRQKRVNESELVRLAEETATWLEEK